MLGLVYSDAAPCGILRIADLLLIWGGDSVVILFYWCLVSVVIGDAWGAVVC